jgi:cell division protein FtsW
MQQGRFDLPRPEKRVRQHKNNRNKLNKSSKSNKKERAEITIYKAGIDRWFLIFVMIMVCAGTAMIFSASYVNALSRFGDSFLYVRRQILMAVAGLGLMTIMLGITSMPKISYEWLKWLKKLTVPFFLGVLVFNFVTPFFGRTIQGGSRWIIIAGIQFQPSELLKLAVVFLFAWYIDKMDGRMREFKYGVLIPGGIILIISLAMHWQSHYSGLIILATLCLAILFIGEAPWQFIGIIGAAGAAGAFLVRMFSSQVIEMMGSRSGRIVSWVDPFSDPSGDGFQIIQSLYAIASGGLTGLGLGQSRQKYLYLPEPQNDFIFSVICEELGFIGALGVITAFIVLIWQGIRIAYRAPDKFSAFIVLGIIIKVAIQFLLNLAVVTNLIPNTGILLPFFSYGGTALVVLLAEMGIILCISRYSYHEKA